MIYVTDFIMKLTEHVRTVDTAIYQVCSPFYFCQCPCMTEEIDETIKKETIIIDIKYYIYYG